MASEHAGRKSEVIRSACLITGQEQGAGEGQWNPNLPLTVCRDIYKKELQMTKL
jgi:hypothetical protein